MSHAIHDARRVLLDTYSVLPWTKEDAECLFTIPGPWNESRCFYDDFRSDTCFSVTRDEILTEADVAKYFHLVEAADRKEVASFVEHKVFELDASFNSINNVDAVWVCKWVSRNPPIVKSQMCGEGSLTLNRTLLTDTVQRRRL